MMAGGDSGKSVVAGGPARHIPVLGRQAVGFLNVRDSGVYIDGTFGAGGYTRAILAAADCKVIGIDRDQTAIALGADLVEQAGGRLTLNEDRFPISTPLRAMPGTRRSTASCSILASPRCNLIAAERGFSFRHDGPLDMRMSRDGATAADVVNSASERDLAGIIFTLGEERLSRAIARAIVMPRIICADRDDARLPKSWQLSFARVPAISIRRRARSRPCAFF